MSNKRIQQVQPSHRSNRLKKFFLTVSLGIQNTSSKIAYTDVQDGLKPVQRAFFMRIRKDTSDRPYRKRCRDSRGRSSETIIRTAMLLYMMRGPSFPQDWKMREPLIDMHGNNGSVTATLPQRCVIQRARHKPNCRRDVTGYR